MGCISRRCRFILAILQNFPCRRSLDHDHIGGKRIVVCYALSPWHRLFCTSMEENIYVSCNPPDILDLYIQFARVLPRRELFWKFLVQINTLGHHLFSNSKPNPEHIPLFLTHCYSLESCIIYEYIGMQKCALINRCLSQCDTHNQIFSLSLIQQSLAVLQCRVTILSYHYPPMHVKNLHSCKALILFTVGVSVHRCLIWAV